LAYIVNYADDMVICCRGNAEEALARGSDVIEKMKNHVGSAATGKQHFLNVNNGVGEAFP
jgi:hypothetical protein